MGFPSQRVQSGAGNGGKNGREELAPGHSSIGGASGAIKGFGRPEGEGIRRIERTFRWA